MIYYFTEKKGCKSLRDELMLFTSLKEAVDQKEHLEEFSGDEYEVSTGAFIVDYNKLINGITHDVEYEFGVKVNKDFTLTIMQRLTE